MIKSGSYFRPVTMLDAYKRIWSPDTYDIDGNPEDAVLERRGEALERFKRQKRKEEEAELKEKEAEL